MEQNKKEKENQNQNKNKNKNVSRFASGIIFKIVSRRPVKAEKELKEAALHIEEALPDVEMVYFTSHPGKILLQKEGQEPVDVMGVQHG